MCADVSIIIQIKSIAKLCARLSLFAQLHWIDQFIDISSFEPGIKDDVENIQCKKLFTKVIQNKYLL